MSKVVKVFEARAGVRLGALPFLVLVGATTLLTSAPSLFRPAVARDWPPRARAVWETLVEISRDYRRWSGSRDVLEVMQGAAQAAAMLVLLLPVLVILRSLGRQSGRSGFAVLVSLILGIAALPSILWFLVTATWVWGVVVFVVGWLRQFGQVLFELAVRITEVIAAPFGVLLGIAAVVAVVITLVRSGRARKWAVLIVLGLISTYLLAHFFEWPFLASALEVARHVLSVGLNWLVSAVEWVFLALLSLFATSLFFALLAQLGVAFWSPFPGAWSAGRDMARSTDFAAGVGVSVSVILTASTVADGFHTRLLHAVTSGPIGAYLEWVPLSFGPLIPAQFVEPLHFAFRGFTGIPEFAVLCICCAFGALSLLFTRPRTGTTRTGTTRTGTTRTGTTRTGTATTETVTIGQLASLAMIRTTLAFMMVLPALALATLFSDD